MTSCSRLKTKFETIHAELISKTVEQFDDIAYAEKYSSHAHKYSRKELTSQALDK